MTAASNLVMDNMDKLERGKILFYPGSLYRSYPLANQIEAEILIMDENYEKFEKRKRKDFDYAVLKL